MSGTLGPPTPTDFPTVKPSGIQWLTKLWARVGRSGFVGFQSMLNRAPVAGQWSYVALDTANHARFQGLTTALSSGQVLTWPLPFSLAWATKVAAYPITAGASASGTIDMTGANMVLTNGTVAAQFFVEVEGSP